MDSTGTVKFLLRAGGDDYDLEEGKVYRIENASVHPDDDGVPAVESVLNLTEIEEIEPGDGTTDPSGADFMGSTDGQAAADGGVKTATPAETPNASGDGRANPKRVRPGTTRPQGRRTGGKRRERRPRRGDPRVSKFITDTCRSGDTVTASEVAGVLAPEYDPATVEEALTGSLPERG